MKHLLDYELLKEWGFEWAIKTDFGDDKDVVNSYLKKDSGETDMHFFAPISLSFYPDPNLNIKWYLEYLGKHPGGRRLFKGSIKDNNTLRCILESCLVFKPTNPTSTEHKESQPLQ